MTRDILAIPLSTIASESTFSTGRRIISDYCSSLKPKTIEALICVQDWLRPYFCDEGEDEDDDIEDEGRNVVIASSFGFFLFENKLSYFVHVFIFCCVMLVPSFMSWSSLETEMINFVNIIR